MLTHKRRWKEKGEMEEMKNSLERDIHGHNTHRDIHHTQTHTQRETYKDIHYRQTCTYTIHHTGKGKHSCSYTSHTHIHTHTGLTDLHLLTQSIKLRMFYCNCRWIRVTSVLTM